MIERMTARDDLILDTPYIRKWREEGFNEGREEGRKEGRKEGCTDARRRSLLDVIALRFEPSISVYQAIEDDLLTITNEKKLKSLLTTAVQSEDLATFKNVMNNLK